MKDWIIHYVKAKDVFTKSLKDYNISEDVIEFSFENHKHYYLFQKLLDDKIINKASKYEKKTIVCEKNEENFNFVIKNFEKLAAINNLILIFLSKDKKEKVLLNPKLHNLIADPDNLKQGLKSLFLD